MKTKITKKFLKEIKPSQDPLKIFDTDLRGFLLRVQPSGYSCYYVECRNSAGRKVTYRIGPADRLTLAEAREEAQSVLARFELKADPAQEKRKAKAKTLNQFLENLYYPWLEQNHKSWKRTKARLGFVAKTLGSKRLSELNTWTIEQWRNKARKDRECKAITLNRDVATLRAALSKAVEWGIIDEHPIKGVKKLKETDSEPKIRYLSQDEEKRLWAALDARDERIRAKRDSGNAWRRERDMEEELDLRTVAFVDHLRPIIITALHTGLRRGEIFGLEWRDVDFDKKTLTVRPANAKSGKLRVVPLNTDVLASLQAWRAQSNRADLVFPGPNGTRLDNIDTSWHRMLDEAKIAGFRFHDLRHTFCSRLVQKGVPLTVVRDLAGHSDFKLTLRYSHLTEQNKADAVVLLEAARQAPAREAAAAAS